MTQYSKTVDTLLLLHDTAAKVASGVGQVGGVDKIVDIGAGRVNAVLQLDVSALVVSTDELYNVFLEGSTSPTFASGIVPLACWNAGHATPNQGSVAETPGRYEIPFTNERDGVTYRYLRLNFVMSGTAESITCVCYIVKN